jgi:hypothetical protein
MKKKKKKLTKAVIKKREKRLAKRKFKEKIEKWKLAVIERDTKHCQKCGKMLIARRKQNPHHIISLQAVKRKYPELLENLMNGVLLCGYCHKFSPDSPHQGSMEFIFWFEKNKPEQYNYLKAFLEDKIKK